MKYNFELEGKLNFDDIEMTTPDEVVAEMGYQLGESTQGIIQGIVKEYDGPIESYDQLSAFASIAQTLGTSTIHKDIQENLGAIGDESFRYEFFLVAENIASYKFRIMFFEYGIGNYPVKVVLEQGIADEIFGEDDADYVIYYASQIELEHVVLNIFKSEKVIKIMQDLINASKKNARLGEENDLQELESEQD